MTSHVMWVSLHQKLMICHRTDMSVMVSQSRKSLKLVVSICQNRPCLQVIWWGYQMTLYVILIFTVPLQQRGAQAYEPWSPLERNPEGRPQARSFSEENKFFNIKVSSYKYNQLGITTTPPRGTEQLKGINAKENKHTHGTSTQSINNQRPAMYHR